ncbi:hypothetical protein LVJ94_06140 [Pendulispora rubella]|uniref:Ribbon-helix-helix protein CopG domain-containing protein n=1 Tax=Pendulispora rubella TaxID=2741070 RepID=A0ABZ2L7S3_9BACT
MKEKKPFSLRLSAKLTARVDQCAQQLRDSGLEVSRTDVARMLIVRALDSVECKVDKLLFGMNEVSAARPPRT